MVILLSLLRVVGFKLETVFVGRLGRVVVEVNILLPEHAQFVAIELFGR